MNSKKMFLSLAPWVVFTLIVHAGGAPAAGWASLAALLLAAVFLTINRDGGLKLIDLTGIATFAIMTAVVFTGSAQTADVVADYGRGGCALLLSLVMLVSAVTVPFTEQYARESVPREYWGSPAFRAVNRKISATWGVVIAGIACGHFIYGYLASTSSDGIVPRPGNLILNWAIPIGLVYLGMKLTARATAGASHHDTPVTV